MPGSPRASSSAKRPRLAASGRNGPSTSRSSAPTDGMLTAFVTRPPSSAAATCSATITPARSCASSVEAARCGVTTMFGACEQRARVRLLREDVDRGAGEPARLERLDQRLLVDELAAGGVDQARAVLHLRERLGADHAARLVVQRQVERDEVGAREHALERVALDPGLAEALGRDERVVGDDVHLQPERRGARPAGRSGRSRARRASSRPARPRPTSSAPSGRRRAPRAPAGCCARARRAGRSCARRPRRCSTRARSRRRSRGASPPRRRRCRRRRPARPITFRFVPASIRSAVSFVAERMTIAVVAADDRGEVARRSRRRRRSARAAARRRPRRSPRGRALSGGRSWRQP